MQVALAGCRRANPAGREIPVFILEANTALAVSVRCTIVGSVRRIGLSVAMLGGAMRGRGTDAG
jgi:hypothetical protein